MEKKLNPIIIYSFEDVSKNNSKFLESMLEYYEQDLRNNIEEMFNLPYSIIKNLKYLNNEKIVEITFKKGTLEKIRSGKLKLPYDKKTRVLRLDVRNQRGQIKELAGLKIKPNHLKKVLNFTLAAAHVISTIDLQKQIEEINKKLNQIIAFQQANRLGQLEGVFNSAKRALRSGREDDLFQTSRELDKLTGSFHQTAIVKLKSLKDPSKISFIKALLSRQKKAEQELINSAEEVFAEIRSMEFCVFLNVFIQYQLNNPDDCYVLIETLNKNLSSLKPLSMKKLDYCPQRSDGLLYDKLFSQEVTIVTRIFNSIKMSYDKRDNIHLLGKEV